MFGGPTRLFVLRVFRARVLLVVGSLGLDFGKVLLLGL